MAAELISILWEGRTVAAIDSKGNFTCTNKRLMVKALKQQGQFWLKVKELTDTLATYRGRP